MAHAVFGAGTAQAVTASNIYVRGIVLTAGSTDATAILYAAGTAFAYLAAKAGSMSSYAINSGGNELGLPTGPGPFTVDVVGTGAHLHLDY